MFVCLVVCLPVRQGDFLLVCLSASGTGMFVNMCMCSPGCDSLSFYFMNYLNRSTDSATGKKSLL